MSRKNRKPPLQAHRRTVATLKEAPPPPLTVSIVTMPRSTADGVSVRGDVELVKAALLYGDKVELISIGAGVIGSVAALAQGGTPSLLAMLTSLDDEVLTQIRGGRALPAGWRQIIPQLVGLSGKSVGEEFGIADAEEGLADISAQLSTMAEELVVSSGADELIPCVEDGTLTLSNAGLEALSDFDAFLPRWTELLQTRLRDRRTKLLFDAQAGDLVSSMLRDGHIEPAPSGIKRAGQAAVGAGLIARLPVFPNAPMDELLDLRRDLLDALVRYRGAVYRLARDVPTGGEDVEAFVDALWEGEVQPAVLEIRERMADHGLVREIARSASQDVKTVMTAASVYVGMSGPEIQNGLIAATAAAGQATVSGLATSRRGRREVERNELFYLYETNRRLK